MFIFVQVQGNSAGQQNWTAVKLPARARGMDAPSQGDNFNHRNTLSISRIKIWAWRRNWAKRGVLQRSI